MDTTETTRLRALCAAASADTEDLRGSVRDVLAAIPALCDEVDARDRELALTRRAVARHNDARRVLTAHEVARLDAMEPAARAAAIDAAAAQWHAAQEEARRWNEAATRATEDLARVTAELDALAPLVTEARRVLHFARAVVDAWGIASRDCDGFDVDAVDAAIRTLADEAGDWTLAGPLTTTDALSAERDTARGERDVLRAELRDARADLGAQSFLRPHPSKRTGLRCARCGRDGGVDCGDALPVCDVCGDAVTVERERDDLRAVLETRNAELTLAHERIAEATALRARVETLTAERAEAVAAARREGAEAMREAVRAEMKRRVDDERRAAAGFCADDIGRDCHEAAECALADAVLALADLPLPGDATPDAEVTP